MSDGRRDGLNFTGKGDAPGRPLLVGDGQGNPAGQIGADDSGHYVRPDRESGQRYRYAFPEVVTLVGSSKFRDQHLAAMRAETLAGRIVIPMGLYGHLEGLDMDGPVKAMLDRLHLAKIDLADAILVVSVDGYIGSSTRNEIDYARVTGKRVRYWEQEQAEAGTPRD